MGKGKKHESAAQERKNLLGINPIPDHASGSWMSKHSITSRGSSSPLNHKTEYQHKHEGMLDTVKNKAKDFLGYQESGRQRNIGWGKDYIPNVSWKSDDWSSGYSAVQDQFKKVAPKLSGKK